MLILGVKTLFVMENVQEMASVISGAVNHLARLGLWTGFHAAHVFPLEHESRRVQYGYRR